jgi:hypothetical protein
VSVPDFYSRIMTSKKKDSWYSVTLNLRRVTEVVPASQTVVSYAPDASGTSVGFTQVPATRYGWDH